MLADVRLWMNCFTSIEVSLTVHEEIFTSLLACHQPQSTSTVFLNLFFSFCRIKLQVIRCPFYFQNSAFQTCLALQALTARPDEVFEGTVLVYQDLGLVPSPFH